MPCTYLRNNIDLFTIFYLLQAKPSGCFLLLNNDFVEAMVIEKMKGAVSTVAAILIIHIHTAQHYHQRSMSKFDVNINFQTTCDLDRTFGKVLGHLHVE